MSEEVHNEQSYAQMLKIPVDPEPFELRMLLLGLMMVGIIIGYGAVTLLFSVGTCSILAIFGGLGLGAGLMQLGESKLKPRWKSHRYLQLSPTSIGVISRGRSEQAFDPSQPVDVHLWRFTVTRRTRVPKGWYVVAFALEHDNIILSVYTLSSPEDFRTMRFARHFTELVGKRDPTNREIRLAGEQRRLLRAEGARNLEGLEMKRSDFETSLEWIQVHFPEWLPLN
jgi:hypothetical protein